MTSHPLDANSTSGGDAVVRASTALLDGEWVGPVLVVCGDGHIARIAAGPDEVAAAEQELAGDGVSIAMGDVLTAGLIDVQVNGCVGVDLAAADQEDWDRVAAYLAAHGVTSFCPTAITAPLPHLVAFADRVAQFDHHSPAGAARSIGAHIEGPFLSPHAPGAHPVELMAEPGPGDATQLAGGGNVALVTVAPEVAGAVAFAEELTAQGVVASFGHTAGTSDDVEAFVDAGATMATHLFNAMPPLHHRSPGPVAVALTDARVTFGLIVDGHHVADQVVRLTFASAPGRVALVSDAMAAAGMEPGEFRIGSVDVHIDDDGTARTADGRLAGSTISLDAAVRHAIGIGIDPVAALNAATITPASAMGRIDLGRLDTGARADLVLWSPDWTVEAVWVAGRPTR